jgi:hypothetical protein
VLVDFISVVVVLAVLQSLSKVAHFQDTICTLKMRKFLRRFDRSKYGNDGGEIDQYLEYHL